MLAALGEIMETLELPSNYRRPVDHFRNTDAGAVGLSGRISDGKMNGGNRLRPNGLEPGSRCSQGGLLPTAGLRWPAALKRSDGELYRIRERRVRASQLAIFRFSKYHI